MNPQFLKDVAGHKLTVLRDEGLYRHLRFSMDGTTIMRFDLITWPGHLLYTGDMGAFVFQRLPDMLEFFRRRESRGLYECIDHRYWAEKLLATDIHGGHREFSPDLFKGFIHRQRVDWVREYRERMTREERRDLWDSMGELIERAEVHSSGPECLQALYDWSWQGDSSGLRLSRCDAGDWPTFDDYTPGFNWCCGALRFGIDLYDKHKEATK